MADNTFQAGTDTIATDDIGGSVKVQRVKTGFGPDGSLTDVSKGSPLPVQPLNGLERLLYEGMPHNSVGTFSGTLTSGAANQNLITLTLTTLSKALWVESVTITSNKQFDAQLSIMSALYSTVGQVHRVLMGQWGSVVLPIRQLWRPAIANAAASSTGIALLNNRNGIDGTLTGALVNVTTTGFSVYDDFDLGADKVCLVIGDSILNGAAGITEKIYSTEWLIREYFRADNQRLRIVNKSISGGTSSDQERQRAYGMLDLPQVDLIVYMLGANDNGAGISTATHKANVAAAIDWKQRTYPTAHMLVIGSSPAENNTTEAALVLYRAADSQAVSEASDSKLHFIDLTACFDRTNTANYASTDTAGSHIHPSDAGHAAMFAVIQTALNSADITL